MSPPFLAAQAVDFAYGAQSVLAGVSLAIERGGWIGIIGPNGAGKSTLLGLLTGCLHPHRGEVLLEGTPLRSLPPAAVAQRLAAVPQAAPLVFGHRVAEVVAMGRHPHQGTLQWRLSPQDADRVVWALDRTGTRRLAQRRYNELSGGEQQLVLIARALAQSTEALLLDEPTAALDLHHQVQIVDVLQRLHRDEGTTIIWVAHDLNLVGRVCSRLALLDAGRIVAEGSPAEILTTERLTAAYRTPVQVEVTASGRRRVDVDLPLEGAPR